MKINETPREGSYAAALTEEQRISLYALLLSGISVAEARLKAPPWPNGTEKDKQPSKPCLWRIRKRLLIEERLRKIEIATATFRATQKLLSSLVNFNPAPDDRIEPGDFLIAMGEPQQLRELELTAGAEASGSRTSGSPTSGSQV